MRPACTPRLLVATAVCAALTIAGCGVSGKKLADSTTSPRTTATTATTAAPTTGTGPTVPTTGGPVNDSWTLVTDPPSGVSFRLPMKPKILRPQVTAPDGASVTVRGYQALINRNLLVQVSIYDLAGRSFDADKAIDGVASSAHGTVTARKHTKSGSLDVVDAKIRISTGPALGYDRVFKIGDHAVQLWTLGLANNETQIRSVQQHLSSTFRAG